MKFWYLMSASERNFEFPSSLTFLLNSLARFRQQCFANDRDTKEEDIPIMNGLPVDTRDPAVREALQLTR